MVLKVSLNTGINRIRLEFKGFKNIRKGAFECRINRIRLEFKVSVLNVSADFMNSINRIRLEFKALQNRFIRLNDSVLIESDWNLKIPAWIRPLCYRLPY